MSKRAIESLRRVEIFEKLSDDELLNIANLCKVMRVPADTVIFNEGDDGDTLFIIHTGSVRVSITTRSPEGTFTQGTINTLYAGQCFGEMVLLGGATRSATVTSAEASILLVLKAADFSNLCEANPRIGYRVMHSLASDLVYKLRSSNILLRGIIPWQHDELRRRSTR